jgi:hypothetical protein
VTLAQVDMGHFDACLAVRLARLWDSDLQLSAEESRFIVTEGSYMSDAKTRGEQFPSDEEAALLFASSGRVAAAAGKVPDGHKGSYEPSADELRQGLQAIHKYETWAAKEHLRIAEAALKSPSKPKKDK